MPCKNREPEAGQKTKRHVHTYADIDFGQLLVQDE